MNNNKISMNVQDIKFKNLDYWEEIGLDVLNSDEDTQINLEIDLLFLITLWDMTDKETKKLKQNGYKIIDKSIEHRKKWNRENFDSMESIIKYMKKIEKILNRRLTRWNVDISSSLYLTMDGCECLFSKDIDNQYDGLYLRQHFS